MFGKKKNDKQGEKPSIITKETMGFTLGVFSVLVLLICITGQLLFGDLGIAVSAFVFGLFGFMTYPVLLSFIYLAITLVTGKNFIPGKGMTASGFCAVALIALLVHAVVTASFPQENYGTYLAECFEAGNNGLFSTPFGFVGGLITYPFTAVATHAGAYILFVAGIGLCGYLFVNSILIYKGIRLKPRSLKTEQKIKNLQDEQSERTKEPVSFADLENNRTAQTAPKYPSYTAPAPAYNTNYENTSYTVNPQKQERYDDDGARFLDGIDNGASAYDRSRNILYGTGNKPEEYRNRNLIFDSSSQYNNRPQNSANGYTLPTQESQERSEKLENSYSSSSYSQMYSKNIDDINSASVQPRQIVQEESHASYGGYSMYKSDIYGSYSEQNDEVEPVRPSYKAPEPAAPVTPVFTERTENFVQREEMEEFVEPVTPPVEEQVTSARSMDERLSLRDRFIADRESQTNETATRTEEQSQEKRIIPEREELSFRKEDIFDDDVQGNAFDEDDEVADFRADEKREVNPYLSRSEEGLSAIRESRITPPTRGEERITPPARTVTPPSREDLTGRGTPVREVPTMQEKQEPPAPPKPRVIKEYVRPSLALFDSYDSTINIDPNEIERNKAGIVETLAGFNISAEVVRVTSGPTFTRYEILIPKNVTVRQVASKAENIAMGLHATAAVNIYSNFSQGTVAIEVPNHKRSTVGMRELLTAEAYMNAKPGSLTFCVGKDVEGKAVCGSLTKMTHMLVAGATGSGKSVFLNELIISLIMKYSPEELRLILIDPKQVEFATYDKLPHLMINEIIADVNKAIVTLNWAINEMEHRYTLFRQQTSAGTAVRNIDEYNAAQTDKLNKLPKLVIIVDEVADLMNVAKKDIEDRISRIAAKARAAGIHLVLATQRPSVDVITGVLKSNLPSRFAFRVASDIDSRVILDENGAENLLGMGDLLYKTGSMFSVERVQGAWIDSPEIQRVCDFIRNNNEAYYDETVSNYINSGGKTPSEGSESGEDSGEVEPVYIDALRYVVQSGSASISMIQRKCSVGYNKAGKIIEWMEMQGYISPFDGAKSRKVLLSADEFRAIYGEL